MKCHFSATKRYCYATEKQFPGLHNNIGTYTFKAISLCYIHSSASSPTCHHNEHRLISFFKT